MRDNGVLYDAMIRQITAYCLCNTQEERDRSEWEAISALSDNQFTSTETAIDRLIVHYIDGKS